MISPAFFIETLKSNGIDFFAGVWYICRTPVREISSTP